MRKPRFLLLACYFYFLCGALQALTLVDPVRMGEAEGTGKTTGTVVILELVNPGEEPRRVVLGPYLIPATQEFQGYLIPGGRTVEIPANDRVRVPLQGFCTDIHRAPVPEGAPVLDPGTWFTPSILWQPEPPLPGAEAWHPPEAFRGTAFRPASDLPTGGRPYVPLFPGSDVPIPWTADINEHPEALAPFAFMIYEAIARGYWELEEAGQIDTPYGRDPERQREAVIQQAFWLSMSAFQGRDPYEEADFKEQLTEQFETATGASIKEQPPARREKFEEGSDDFWNAIELTGTSAKVIRDNTRPDGKPEPEPKPEPVSEPEPASVPEAEAEPEAETKRETEPGPVLREKGLCEDALGAPGGGLQFSRGGTSVTIRGNQLIIDTEDGESLSWEFGMNVQNALQHGESSNIQGETTSVQTQASSDGETYETSSSTDLTVAAPDPSTQDQPTTNLGFAASLVGPDGKLREYSVSLSLDLETCTWMMQVQVEDAISEFTTRPPRPAVAVLGDIWSGTINGIDAWRSPDFWKKMFSLHSEIARWYGWLEKNPGDVNDRSFIQQAWSQWAARMAYAIHMARNQGDLTSAQERALDAMESALERARNGPLDPGVIEALIGIYNTFAVADPPSL